MEVTQSVLQDMFAMIMLVEIDKSNIGFEQLRTNLKASLVPHLDGQRVLYPEPQVAPVFPIRLQFLVGRKIDGLRLFDVGDQLRRCLLYTSYAICAAASRISDTSRTLLS